MKPNKERIKLWVKALRSGKFKQGRDTLRDEKDRCCCLGVACEVAKANGLNLRLSRVAGGSVAYNKELMVLPAAVKRWFGFESANPSLELAVDCCYANDDLDLSLREISNAIERTYLKDDAA